MISRKMRSGANETVFRMASLPSCDVSKTQERLFKIADRSLKFFSSSSTMSILGCLIVSVIYSLQNLFRAPATPRSGHGLSRRTRAYEGHDKTETRAPARLAFQPDAAAVQLDE